MSECDRLIKLLDGADLFLRNRANAEPAPLNEYDIENLNDIAKVCDEAARALEKAIIPPCKVGDMLFALWSVPTEAKYVIYSAEVVEIRTSGRNRRQITTFLLEPLAYRGRKKEYRTDDFGKLVFTNKEEAEQALSKLQASYEQVKEGVQE